MPALQTKKNTASKPVKDKVKDSERPRPTDIAGNEKIKSKNRSDEIDLTGLESERDHPSTSKTKSSIFIAGDSVVKDVRGWLLSRHKYVKVYSFSGADTTDNKKRSHTQLDSRKQVIAFQDRVITINIKEAQHPLK